MEISIDRTTLPPNVLSKGCICVVDSVRELSVLVQHKQLFFEDCFVSNHVSIFGNLDFFVKWHATLLCPQELSLCKELQPSHIFCSISDIAAYCCIFLHPRIPARGRNTIQPISVLWRHSTPSRHSISSCQGSASLDQCLC